MKVILDTIRVLFQSVRADVQRIFATMVKSWDDLDDKPFGLENVFFEYSLDKPYLESVDVPDLPVYRFIKVSDEAPPSEFFIGKYLVYTVTTDFVDGIFTEETMSGVIRAQDIDYEPSGKAYAVVAFIVCTEDVTIDSGKGSVSLTKGCWVADVGIGDIRMIKYAAVTNKINRIQDIFIPDTIVRREELEDIGILSSASGYSLRESSPSIASIKNASVGQVIVVKSVDENGNITELEAVDL